MPASVLDDWSNTVSRPPFNAIETATSGPNPPIVCIPLELIPKLVTAAPVTGLRASTRPSEFDEGTGTEGPDPPIWVAVVE